MLDASATFPTSSHNLPTLREQADWLRGERRWTAAVGAWRQEVNYGSGRQWFVVRTNPRCEDRALANLSAAGFDAFLPKGKREIVHHRTKAKIERSFALMVGYLFVAVPVAEQNMHWPALKACQGVRGMLGTEKGPLALPGREVELLRLAEKEDRIRFERAQWTVLKGMQVRIANGPFTSFVGEVIDDEVQGAITLLINLFNGMVQVTVPVDDLEIV